MVHQVRSDVFQHPIPVHHHTHRSNLLGFGPGLLATLGEHHRQQRKLLNPVFSIAHMRRMVPIFHSVAHKLQDAIEMRLRAADEADLEIDMLMWMGRTALELVGQVGLGYSFDPLVSDSADEFGAAVKATQWVLSRPAYVIIALIVFCRHRPALVGIVFLRRLTVYLPTRGKALQRWLLDRLPHPRLQRVKDIIDTLQRCAVTVFESKKAALAAGDESVARQVGEGKDIMSILSTSPLESPP